MLSRRKEGPVTFNFNSVVSNSAVKGDITLYNLLSGVARGEGRKGGNKVKGNKWKIFHFSSRSKCCSHKSVPLYGYEYQSQGNCKNIRLQHTFFEAQHLWNMFSPSTNFLSSWLSSRAAVSQASVL